MRADLLIWLAIAIGVGVLVYAFAKGISAGA